MKTTSSIFHQPERYAWTFRLVGFTAALALAGFVALGDARAQHIATPQLGTFAPDITNGNAYNNNAIIGLDSETSFIRLANFRDETTRNYIEIYSLDDERTLGRFEIDVPSKASLQLNYLEIVAAAGLNYSDVAQKELVAYVQNGREKQLWQHVQYNDVTRTLSDASVCTFAPAVDYIPVQNVAINVHSSMIRNSLSLITIHNFADVDGTFDANVYDSKTGTLIGTLPLNLAARTSFNEAAAWFEEQLGYVPLSNQYHYNIELVPTSIPHGKVVVGHAVMNMVTGSGDNLSNPCAIHGGIITLDLPDVDNGRIDS